MNGSITALLAQNDAATRLTPEDCLRISFPQAGPQIPTEPPDIDPNVEQFWADRDSFDDYDAGKAAAEDAMAERVAEGHI